MLDADYVIIGAGSAGCVLAARLSEDPTNRVVLIEAGGSDRSVSVQMPAALSRPMNSRRFDWGFYSEPEPGLNGRRLHCPRGRGLGGSSSINGMVYVRGHACDFDEWEERGALGWSYRDCLPYFRKAENWIGGENEYRGGHGLLPVGIGNGMQGNPLYQAFISAGEQAGYPRTDDYNGYQQEGFGGYHMTVGGGVRASTAQAYLRPILGRSNLRVVTQSQVHRIVLEGRRAVAVVYELDGHEFQLGAQAEVIVCAGAIGSPVILQRSGIGPAAHLSDMGIAVVHPLEGVGQNLQDHLEIYLQHRCREPITLNGKLGYLQQCLIGLRWLLFKDGLGATNHFEAGGFIRSQAGIRWPDIQFHFLPGAMRYDGRSAVDGHGFQVHVGLNKVESRGRVQIRSSNPRDLPSIQFNYLQHHHDQSVFRRAVRLTREVLAQSALDRYRGEEVQPSASRTTDEDLDAWIRANAESAYHPSCTCTMGNQSAPATVVDPACRVVGIEHLRVVDSSVFPTITNGNLNAPTIMLAERAADLILDKTPLAAIDVPVWVDPEWATRQRSGQAHREGVAKDSVSDPTL